MMNYTECAALHLDSAVSAHDVLDDVISDLRGMGTTAKAIAEQQDTIEGEQLHPIAEMAWCMSEALEAVRRYVDGAEGVA